MEWVFLITFLNVERAYLNSLWEEEMTVCMHILISLASELKKVKGNANQLLVIQEHVRLNQVSKYAKYATLLIYTASQKQTEL